MKTYILNSTLITPHLRNTGVNVVIENGHIQEITKANCRPEKDSLQINASNLFLCPGLIDIHFHGATGRDTMDGNLQSLQILSDYCAEHGVTAFYPTTVTASTEQINKAINNVENNKDRLYGAQALGVHLEGPYVNVDYRGAQAKSLIRNPHPDEYRQWINSGIVKLITCAPEIPGCLEFIDAAVGRGIQIVIGHSEAIYDQVIDAGDHGATQATHLFNGMLGLHHREPGTVGGILADDRFYPQIIVDGVHLHPAIVKIVVAVKSVDNAILITDSIRGAGCPDGDYDDIGLKFSVRNGIARTPEGGLSGSTLSLDKAVINTMKFTGKPLEEIICMATSVPAKAMGISANKGNLAIGSDADLVLFSREMYVEKTLVGGKVVYERNVQ